MRLFFCPMSIFRNCRQLLTLHQGSARRSTLGSTQRVALIAIMAWVLTGCATSSDLYQARAEFASGEPIQALYTLDNAEVSKRNKLLLLLDKGAIAFSAGQYKLAQEALLEANDLIEAWNQIRVGEQASTLVTAEWAKRYRGESSEQLWVHSYLMMAFLLQNNPEGAAVEARRALVRIEEHEKTLHNDWFTRALIALSFEAAGVHDSAQVEYRKLIGDEYYDGAWNNVIQRHTKRLGRDPIPGVQDASFIPLETDTKLDNNEGELIVFLQAGEIARKLPGDLTLDIDLRIAFPFYADYQTPPPEFEVFANGDEVATDYIDTSLDTVAKNALGARGNSIAAKQVARIATKKAIGRAARSEDEFLGAVVQILLFVTEQADTRSWETLPEWFSMIRIALPEGKNDVSLTVFHEGIEERVDLGEVFIEAGKLHFANYRTNQPLPLDDGFSFDAPESVTNLPTVPLSETVVPPPST